MYLNMYIFTNLKVSFREQQLQFILNFLNFTLIFEVFLCYLYKSRVIQTCLMYFAKKHDLLDFSKPRDTKIKGIDKSTKWSFRFYDFT